MDEGDVEGAVAAPGAAPGAKPDDTPPDTPPAASGVGDELDDADDTPVPAAANVGGSEPLASSVGVVLADDALDSSREGDVGDATISCRCAGRSNLTDWCREGLSSAAIDAAAAPMLRPALVCADTVARCLIGRLRSGVRC